MKSPSNGLRWTRGLMIRIPSADAEHRDLVLLLQRIETARCAGEGRRAMGGLLAALEAHAAAHFAAEERLMAEMGYPEIGSHRARHQDFARRVARFREKFLAGRARVDREVVGFLESWLLIHIQSADRGYAEFARARRQATAGRGARARS